MRPAQYFFTVAAAASRSGSGTLRAVCGQIWMQRIQEMHLRLSTFFGASFGIAPAGQLSAHRPQLMQRRPPVGLSGRPL